MSSVAAAARHLLNRPVLAPVLAGLLLVLSCVILDCPAGFVCTTIDTFVATGLQRYFHLDVNDETLLISPALTVLIPALLCLAVWLSLSLVSLRRPRFVLAVALLWAGALLIGSGLLAHAKGWYISPAQPLLASILLSYFLPVFDHQLGRLRHSFRLDDLSGFKRRLPEAIATPVEAWAPGGSGYIARIQHYVGILTDQLIRSRQYGDILTPKYRELLIHLCPFHDIGKAGIRDAVLSKRERLTAEETAEMQRHVEHGEALLRSIEWREDEQEFLDLVSEIISSHHERWDGSGYPRGLKGEEIPLAGRIVAAAVIYDGLISRRCYKNAYTREQSRAILMKGRGTILDPAIADAFREIEEEMWKISLIYRDSPGSVEDVQD